MDANPVNEFRNIGPPWNALIQPGPGFRMGSEGARFALVQSGDGQSTHRDATNNLQVDVSLRRTGDTFIIGSKLTAIGPEPACLGTVIEPLHLRFAQPSTRWRHIFANGGTHEGHYPPVAYRTQDWTQATWPLRLASHPLGRSSNQHLPLLISLASAESASPGFFVGMEWSGAWTIRFEKHDAETSELSVGVQVNDLRLSPGESLDLPAVHLGFFQGGPDGGTNALRRYLYEQVCPPYRGQPPLPRVSYDHYFGLRNKISEDLLRPQARRAAEMGIEVFVVDAGYFPGEFPFGVGNWRVDDAKFPHGLRGIADYVRSLGLDFGLWSEIERAAPGTDAVVNHPEFFFPPLGNPPDDGIGGLQHHLNLARKDAQDWAIETLSAFIRELDVRWLRFDYNIEPMQFWKAADPTLKVQFDYFKGLYRVLDTLMAEHPNLMIESTASGGRRLDIGTIRRAHTSWFSDSSFNPIMCRYQQAHANRFLPGNLLNSSVAVELGNGDKGLNETSVLCRMLGKLQFDGDIAGLSPELAGRMGGLVQAFKEIRHLLVQDFYQLLPQPATIDEWDAVQFVSRSGNEAALFGFSGQAAGQINVRLRGLDAARSYRVRRVPDGPGGTRTGRDLMDQGLTLELEARRVGSGLSVNRVAPMQAHGDPQIAGPAAQGGTGRSTCWSRSPAHSCTNRPDPAAGQIVTG